MPHFVVTYRYTADTTGRDALRAEHRTWLADREQLLISGPTDDNGAMLILRTTSPDVAASTLDADPFAVHGLIAARTITGWDPVVGPLTNVFREPHDTPQRTSLRSDAPERPATAYAVPAFGQWTASLRGGGTAAELKQVLTCDETAS